MNQCTFVGNLGRDPESRKVGENIVCNFSIAVRRPKKNGEERDPIWVKCAAWGKTGEIAEEYLRKGHQVCVSGAVDLETWEDKDGKDQVSLVLNVNQLSLLKNGEGGERDDRGAQRGRDDDRGGRGRDDDRRDNGRGSDRGSDRGGRDTKRDDDRGGRDRGNDRGGRRGADDRW